MAGKSVLLKLPSETHAQVLGASERHQRSMQKLLVALIEGWLAQGAPDPVEFAAKPAAAASASPRSVEGVDQRVRQAIDLLAQHILKLQSSVQELQQWRNSADRGSSHDDTYWEHFSEALDALVRNGDDAPVSPLQALIDQTFNDSNEIKSAQETSSLVKDRMGSLR